MFQNLLFKKEPIKVSIQYTKTVRIIPLPGNSDSVCYSDKEIGRVWENYRSMQGNFHHQTATVLHRNGTGCPVSGYTRCDVSDCFYTDFIRIYWVVPGAINRSKKTLGSVKTGLAAVVIINKMKGEMVKTWKSRIEIITR